MTVADAAPDRYVLFGHPVSHSRSPLIHGMFAAATGQRLEYGLVDATPERFADALRGFFGGGGRGANVTVPHKEAAAKIVTQLSVRAREAGAVNTISRGPADELIGDNTDGAGLVTDLTRNIGLALQGCRILLLGAGGAARGVLGPLLAADPATLVLANRTAERATRLAREFGDRPALSTADFGGLGAAPFDLVINATAASLAGQAPDIPAGVVGPDTVGYDMAYANGETPFTRWVLAHGARAAHKGWGMLVEQAAEAFFIWRGVRPQTGPVLARLTAGA